MSARVSGRIHPRTRLFVVDRIQYRLVSADSLLEVLFRALVEMIGVQASDGSVAGIGIAYCHQERNVLQLEIRRSHTTVRIPNQNYCYFFKRHRR